MRRKKKLNLIITIQLLLASAEAMQDDRKWLCRVADCKYLPIGKLHLKRAHKLIDDLYKPGDIYLKENNAT